MPDNDLVNILLVDDDEDQHVIVRDLLDETGQDFSLDWIADYEEALKTIRQSRYDACLIDYRLGDKNGLDLVREAVASGCRMPLILLTGQGDREVDVEAMNAGAADYLVKGHVDSALLERSVRYAVEARKAETSLLSDRNRLFRALQSINDAVVAVDAAGGVAFINRIALELTGWNEREALGKPVTEILAVRNGTASATVPGGSDPGSIFVSSGEAVLTTRDGLTRTVSGTTVRSPDADAGGIGSVLVFRETTRASGEDRPNVTQAVERLRLARRAPRTLPADGPGRGRVPPGVAAAPIARDPRTLVVSGDRFIGSPPVRGLCRGVPQAKSPTAYHDRPAPRRDVRHSPSNVPALGGGLKFVAGGETSWRDGQPGNAGSGRAAWRGAVLVADDDAPSRMVCRLKLEEAGYRVEEARTGTEAWQSVASGEVDCIVLDMKLPGYHGLEVLNRMVDAGLMLPVVVITAYDQFANDFVVATYPNLTFFVKPVPPEKVVRAVETMLTPKAEKGSGK